MSWPRILTLMLVPVLVGIERFAYYAVRSVLILYLTRDLGLTTAEAFDLYARFTWMALLTPLLGGALALAIGPRVTAAIGAVLAALGFFLLAAGANGAFVWVSGLGVGLFKACPWAILADAVAREESPSGDPADAPLSPRRFPLMVAMTAFVYLAINVGAFLSSSAGALAATRSGFTSVFVAAGVVMVGAVAIAVVIALLPLAMRAERPKDAHAPYRAPAMPGAPSASVASVGPPLLGLLVLFGAIVPYHLALPVTGQAAYFLQIRSALATVNPLVVIVASALGFAFFLAAALSRWSFPLTWPFGGALVVFGLGLIPIVAASNALTFALGTAVTGVAEAIIEAVALAYVALATGRRIATLTVAVWLALASVLSFVPVSEVAWRFELAAFAALALLAGALVLIFGRRLHRFAFDPPLPNSPAFR
jgi:dipeptide/tripeptide permease